MRNFGIIFCSLITGALLFFGCENETKKDSDATIIEGTIQAPTAKKIYYFSYSDSVDFFLAKMSPLDSATIDENGHFLFNLKIEQTGIFNLQYSDKNLVSNLFICKGDHLNFKFHGKSNILKIEPIGKEAKFNTFILQFVDTFYNETFRHNEYYIASNYMDIQQFEIYNEKRKKEMLEFFNNYFKDDSLKTIYNSYALNTICYELASDRLMYLWKKRMKGEPQKPDSSFLKFANPSFAENKEAFITPSYIRFINLYLRDTYERMVENGTLPVKKGDVLNPSVEKYKLALQLFKQPFLDAVLYDLIINDMNDVSNQEINVTSDIKNLDSLIVVFEKKYSLN